MDDLDKEHQREAARLLAKIGRLEKENLELARQRNEAKDKLKERTRQYYETAAELEEERGKNKKLTAQVNKDFENSSIPSSKQKKEKKKIPNSREKTGEKPGGSQAIKTTPENNIRRMLNTKYLLRLNIQTARTITKLERSAASRGSASC